jgi:hypothetical protein
MGVLGKDLREDSAKVEPSADETAEVKRTANPALGLRSTRRLWCLGKYLPNIGWFFDKFPSRRRRFRATGVPEGSREWNAGTLEGRAGAFVPIDPRDPVEYL